MVFSYLRKAQSAAAPARRLVQRHCIQRSSLPTGSNAITSVFPQTPNSVRTSSSSHYAPPPRQQRQSLKPSSILSIPAPFLRAYDASNFDPHTFQRNDVPFDGHSGKPGRIASKESSSMSSSSLLSPSIHDCIETDKGFHIKWEDGKESFFTKKWVQEQLQLWQSSSDTSRVLWTGLNEAKVRASPNLSIDYAEILTENGMKHALKSLYQYGILLVKETPLDDNGVGIAALGAALGGGAVKNHLSIYKTYKEGHSDLVLPHGTDGPLRTLYGTVWATASGSQVEGSSRADSAYGSDGLPLHTDMTYHRDPPGLQIFTMAHPSSSGGESVFGDGFAAAELLRKKNPKAFAMLSSTVRRYRSRDPETGWHLEATGPVIQIDAAGKVVAIRHNDLDRLPDLPPPHIIEDEEAVASFYKDLEEAHAAWNQILGDDEVRLVMSLNTGETMVVANQRCFHGRFGFCVQPSEKPRAVMGCYVSQDELNSRFRMEGFVVPV